MWLIRNKASLKLNNWDICTTKTTSTLTLCKPLGTICRNETNTSLPEYLCDNAWQEDLRAQPSERNSASSTEQHVVPVIYRGSAGPFLATAILSSIRLLLLPRWVLHDKWEASSSLVQRPLWLASSCMAARKPLSHPHRGGGGGTRKGAEHSLQMTACAQLHASL